MQRDDGWKRRQAIQIAAQLPEDPQEALDVLMLAQRLVEGFLAPQGDLLPFRTPAVSGSAPSLRAISTGKPSVRS